MNKKIIFFLVLAFGLLKAFSVYAICPVCTIAVGAGIGLSRWLGIDDSVTGLWVGALIVSISMWTLDWLTKKNIKFQGMGLITLIVYAIFVIIPLYFMGIMGHPLNTLWGFDKLLVGIIFGGIFFFLGGASHFYLKKKNGDKVYFPFQKVAFAIAPVIILSIVFYLITK
jgi:hypothetical protein